MSHNFILEFEKIIQDLFEMMGYETTLNTENSMYNNLIGVDMIADGEDKKYVDIKFYRSKAIPAKTLKAMAARLAFSQRQMLNGSGLLVVNTVTAEKLKQEIQTDYGVDIWDREVIYSLLTKHSPELRDEFERLLLAAQQGNETYDVFSGLVAREPSANYGQHNRSANFKQPEKPKGIDFKARLDAVPCGKEGWVNFEQVCQEILKYLFETDLTLWEKQLRTDDGLSRFDLICRIASNDDYWKALISSFNTRYILFEFKNYCDKITQDQIYATERYLYTKGLRSVAFIVTAAGATPNAEQAAKGALKENGKLIMFLTRQDLHKMIDLKDRLESCNDYLSGILDNWLLSLSR